MNTIDIVSLVLVAILMLLGLWHGLLRGIFRLLAWFAAVAGAYLANRFFAASVVDVGFSEFSATVICLCAGFLVPFLALLFASHMINRAVSDTVVGKVDRILGAFFGIIKAVIILAVILSIFHVMPFGGILKETRDNSVSYELYKTALEALGYSTEPVDLVGAAERKASEITENLVNKASAKASEVADKAAEAAKETVDKATEAASEAAQKAAKDATEKAVKQISEKVSSESEESKEP